MIRQPLMFRDVFRRDDHAHSRRRGGVNVLLITLLAVHVYFKNPSSFWKRFKQGFPEIIAAGGNAALAVNAESDSRDLRDRLQNRLQSIAAVRRMIGPRQPVYRIIGAGAVSISMRPKSQLELESPPGAF